MYVTLVNTILLPLTLFYAAVEPRKVSEKVRTDWKRPPNLYEKRETVHAVNGWLDTRVRYDVVENNTNGQRSDNGAITEIAQSLGL